MIILDGTIVTVVLPAIQRDLGFAPSALSWVMNAYLVPFGGLLLAGRLGDLAGRKRVFLAGLALFTAASLACGLSASPVLLVAARFAQGTGAALVSAVSLGMIATLYPAPPERARAIAASSFVGAAGASIGLILGGVLTQALSWHWILAVTGWPSAWARCSGSRPWRSRHGAAPLGQLAGPARPRGSGRQPGGEWQDDPAPGSQSPRPLVGHGVRAGQAASAACC